MKDTDAKNSADIKEGMPQSYSNLQTREMLLRIANDFNNLLVGIIGNARILLEEKFVRPAGIGHLTEIIGCAERCTRLTLQLELFDDEEKDGRPQLQSKGPENAQSDVGAKFRRVASDVSKYCSNANTVLVIDDEEVVRNVSTAILERAGFKVIATGSGKEGIEIFDNNRDRIHSVLLDLTMPYIRGNLVFARLKAIDANVRVFLMSGYSDKQILREFESEDIAGYIKKPFEADDLLNALSSISISGLSEGGLKNMGEARNAILAMQLKP